VTIGRRLIIAALVGMVLIPPGFVAVERIVQSVGLATFWTSCGVVSWLVCGSTLWRRHRAGPVLLELERPASARVSLALVALAVASSLVSLLALHQPYMAFYQLSVGMLVLVWMRNGAELRARGLTGHLCFIPWSRVARYSLVDDYNVVNSLAVTTHTDLVVEFGRGRRRRLGRRTIRCPVERRQVLVALMAEHMPATGRRSSISARMP
jgi:hypothetical protein